MIGKVMKNNSFHDTCRYVLTKAGAELIGGNMAGQSLSQLVQEFRLSATLNARVKFPVYHFALSLPAEEDLDSSTFSELGDQYVKRMGLDLEQHQYIAVRHTDQDHHHIHIIAGRVNFITNKAIPTWNDHYRSQVVCRQLEREYKLQEVASSPMSSGLLRQMKNRYGLALPEPSLPVQGRKAMRSKQRKKLDSSGVLPVQYQIQEAIQRVAAATGAEHPTTMPRFVQQLQAQGITVQIHWVTNRKATKAAGTLIEKVQGISYQLNGVAMSGNDLGAWYTFPGLQRHFDISYDPARDDAALRDAIANPSRQDTTATSASTPAEQSPAALPEVTGAQGDIAPLIPELPGVPGSDQTPAIKRTATAWDRATEDADEAGDVIAPDVEEADSNAQAIAAYEQVIEAVTVEAIAQAELDHPLGEAEPVQDEASAPFTGLAPWEPGVQQDDEAGQAVPAPPPEPADARLEQATTFLEQLTIQHLRDWYHQVQLVEANPNLNRIQELAEHFKETGLQDLLQTQEGVERLHRIQQAMEITAEQVGYLCARTINRLLQHPAASVHSDVRVLPIKEPLNLVLRSSGEPNDRTISAHRLNGEKVFEAISNSSTRAPLNLLQPGEVQQLHDMARQVVAQSTRGARRKPQQNER